MNRRDPRIRQTLDRISTTLESANTATQTTFYDLSSHYLNPCLDSVSQCLSSTCAPCVNFTRDRARARQRAIMRSQRPEAVFDFYADWDDDIYDYENAGTRDGGGAGGSVGSVGGGGSSSNQANERTGLLRGWGVDELDRLLAGRPKEDQQPRRQRNMTYGTTAKTRRGSGTGRAKDEMDDPNVVPSSSKFGFLERLPFKFGPRGLRYKPSAANMQEGLSQRRDNNGDIIHEEDEEGTGDAARRRYRTEGQALLGDVDGDDGVRTRTRGRSHTVGSEDTDTSLSSRGDLFPSDDEDDAVMIDDEMALALGRRHAGGIESPGESGGADESSQNSLRRKRPSMSRKSTKSGSQSRSKSSKSLAGKGRSFSGDSLSVASPTILESPEPLPPPPPLPTMDQLREEEELVRRQEEESIRRKREEARRLAIEKGLTNEEELAREDRERALAQAQEQASAVATSSAAAATAAATGSTADTAAAAEDDTIKTQNEDGDES